jgi:hypothetical protein
MNHTPLTRRIWEREIAAGAALVPVALAPGGAREEWFQKLYAVWAVKPHGVSKNLPEARKLFLAACQEAGPEEVLASARAWVADTPNPRFLMKLEDWLQGAWRNKPPAKRKRLNGHGSNGHGRKLNAQDLIFSTTFEEIGR